MPDEHLDALEFAVARQRQHLKDPWPIRPILLRPCPVRILLVTDGGGSFGLDDFGLRALLDALATSPGPWVRFAVTTAHRRANGTAALPDFRFDAHDLSPYDQVWLFGVERTGGDLADTELRALAEFMDGGGGVFATGDHEDLGVGMCGRVPRVRSMRKWHWPAPGPNGEPVAPSGTGPDRLDTLSAGNDPGVSFDDQSDDVPQRIVPKLYSSWPWSPYFHRSHPHPLLCGPRGMIRHLPDHPHEGECYEPSDLSASFTFAGYSTTEYPGGVAPEVIAWSSVGGARSSSDVKGVLHPRSFGAVGAYDGFRAGVGRVVVDATWHHFFNINLVGELNNQDPIKGVGFAASPSGAVAYEEIKSYYRNIAVWLARESTQGCMWWKALWWARWHHRIAMDVRPPRRGRAVDLDLSELLRIGGEARDALGHVASRCTVRRWILDHLIRLPFPRTWRELVPVLDPWHPRPPLPDPPPDGFREPNPEIVSGLHGEMLLDALLGAAVHAVAAKFPLAEDGTGGQAEDTDFAEVVGEHLGHAVREFAAHVGREGDALRTFGKALNGRDSD